MSTTTCNITPAAPRGLDGLAIIGRTTHDLRGIRFAEGDGGNGGSGGDGQGGAGTSTETGTGNGQGGGDAPWTRENFDPERAQRLVANLRGDIDKLRTGQEQAITDAVTAAVTAAQADWTKNLAAALGGGEQQETDPAKLQASVADLTQKVNDGQTALTTAQAQVAAGELALQVAIIGGPLGANIPALLANEQFKTSIAKVAPTDAAEITKVITQALQDNAALKQPPARAGHGEHTGPTIQSLESQLKAAEEKNDVGESIRLKRAIAAARTAQTQ